LTRYRVEYEIEGTYDPGWAESLTFLDSKTGDGMIKAPFPDDNESLIPYRIPKNAQVTEILADGYYLSRTNGLLYRRISEGVKFSWQRFSSGSRGWVDTPHWNELEWFQEHDFEKLEVA
jgi:hypothetical protein